MLDQVVSAGPDHALRILGVRMIGFNAITGRKVLLTIAFTLLVFAIAAALRAIAKIVNRHRSDLRAQFWTRQALQILTVLLLVLSYVSIWFDNPSRFGTMAGLITAGIAVASQKLITAFAAYFVILRGRLFNIGDRIVMGGVRGDVISLGFMRTTIMEMGQPPDVQSDEPAMWVAARQYTGRIVSVTNDRIFESAVYNYSRSIPFIWEELRLPVRYGDDHERVEKILLDAAHRHTVGVQELSKEALEELARRTFIRPADVAPRVFYRLTDNWTELTVRFVVQDSGIRDVKDAMSRDILRAMTEAGIPIASETLQLVR